MTTASYYFSGDIAEIQLYRQALNATEMAALDRSLAGTYAMSGVAGALVNRWVADSLSGKAKAAQRLPTGRTPLPANRPPNPSPPTNLNCLPMFSMVTTPCGFPVLPASI